jgi:AcrR family transcriptional regulator
MPDVTRTRLTAAERRETILVAAAEVFATTGYRAGKVSDVAARVGVSEPVVFQNFGSKAALFAAVLDRVAAAVGADLGEMVDRFGSVSALLVHVLDHEHMRRAHAPGAHGALFADAASLAADPDLAGPARHALQTVAGHLADLIRRGQADGDIRQDADPEAAAWLLLSIMSARPLYAAAMPGRDRLEPGVTALALRALTVTGPPAAESPVRA